MRELSLPQARRAVLRAQGFGISATADARGAIATIRRLGVVQIDSVNVLVRSHYLPLFSRLGPYDRALLERLAYRRPRRLFEYWAHEASYVPIEWYPLLRWRMERAAAGRGMWKNVARVGTEERELVARVHRAFQERGPMSASEFVEGKGTGSWWGWNDTKRAVEFLFWSGAIAAVKRRSSFERVYDLTERVISPEWLRAPVPDEAAAQRALIAIAARALGVATEADLRDYFRLDAADAKARVAELTEAGELEPVRVESWKTPAYLHPGTVVPRSVEVSSLLSPFDSLVWNRARTHRLFDFHYRLEIYTPAHRRVHGYYVLPYLYGDRLCARVDLKADRAARLLRVQAVHWEPRAERRTAEPALRDDLARMAAWLELDRVVFSRAASHRPPPG